MEREQRNAIGSATQQLRKLLEREYAEQLDGVFDVRRSGEIAAQAGVHLDTQQRVVRTKVLAAVDYYQKQEATPAEAVTRFTRESAFTTLNRFVALKMLEARELVQQCISEGEDSSGYQEFIGFAPGVVDLGTGQGYRLYLESLFDELSAEIKVLFDRRDSASLLWPRHNVVDALLHELNAETLADVWDNDETIGWFYQFFNSKEERQQMRDESPAPRNSRELAVRNQFFTPRYVVEFLVDNTLTRTWSEMNPATPLLERCEYFVELEDERPARPIKDPRDFRVLDPACGSGHFLLYAFGILESMYRDAWQCGLAAEESAEPGLSEMYPTESELDLAIPTLILERNLFGIEIDRRAAQIGALALWLRAQRSWRETGIDASNRPAIRRTGIVVAEPMPGDPEMVDDFAESLDPPLLGTLFREIVDSLTLAGEMGYLLRAEVEVESAITRAKDAFVAQRLQPEVLPGLGCDSTGGAHDFAGLDEDSFFIEAEHRLLGALADYVSAAQGAQNALRRMFADDAAHGVALLEVLRERYDVVLMNPPFGDPVEGTFSWLKSHYSGFHNDIYASFLKRGLEMAPRGVVGAITSRSFLVAPRLEKIRSEVVAKYGRLMVDLGMGVMDDALVEAAAFTLGSHGGAPMIFIDAREGRHVAHDIETRSMDSFHEFRVPRSALGLLPKSIILYQLPGAVFRSLQSNRHLEPQYATAREGGKTFDNERFLRLRWEVSRAGSEWVNYAKGGPYAFGVSPTTLLVNWRDEGAELRAVNQQHNGSTSQVRQASKYWYRPGVTYSKRSSRGFSARLMPEGTIFSSKGPAVIPTNCDVSPYALVAILNCRTIRGLVALQANAAEYSTGSIKRLPWPELGRPGWHRVEELTAAACQRMAAILQHVDPSPYYVTPAVFSASDPLEGLRSELQSLDEVVSAQVRVALDIPDDEWTFDLVPPSTGWIEMADKLDAALGDPLEELWSWAFGVAIGRFSIPDERTPVEPPDPLGLPPVHPPAVIHPPQPNRVTLRSGAAGNRQAAKSMVAVLESVRGRIRALDPARAIDEAAIDSWIANRFFDLHLGRYTDSRRMAPVYWPIGTRSGSYVVWLYAHGVTGDSLFRLLADVVEPDLGIEQRRLEELTHEAGPNPSASQRKAIEAHETLVGEIKELRDSLDGVTPLWAPDLNDGIVTVLAPLWKLFAYHKSWSRELKKHWDKLAAGEYDWAHLAMHLWPERVILKCAQDRSLAIAHGLEDVFWVQDADNEGKWYSHPTSTTPIGQLIADRHNPVTTAALQRTTT